MKKLLSLVLVLVLAVTFVTGCGSTATQPGTDTDSAASTAPGTTSNTEQGTGDAVKTGLAVISTAGSSTDAGEKDGLAEVDSVAVAVAVDKDGKIVKCAIDTAQTKINFSKEGKVLSDLKAEYKSKQELGADYGMKKASKIGKEWFEQANAFADYAVGKTVAEIKGIAVNQEGITTDAELSTSVTIHISDYVAAVEKAVNNAKDLGAKAGDKLGLAIVTSISGSKDAGENDGLAQAYSNYTATTFDASGKITSCVIDASQSNVNFSKEGKITSDLKAQLQTKDELGEAYGMKKASKIGKEWSEQADAFSKYVVGKTVDEVKGIAVNEEGVATAAELTSSVTVHISDFTSVIEKASKSAK
ncbi:hypothetical protein [Ruminiclostridium cellobioparum]|jgi:hypothetical protein|uniref:Uncharacterized protein n=1 Tax=Ruminiclostridium cellobioparum subsp. termitidis CT1112 TaxID=1195236 RepID=S0FNH8_RUMCE|nr:hypothetical protein [Ruminiclostridium cellobioparum]EMS70694.1 hypothetical protein CTER_3525 [Ruminiclostridium cellobioparum subsp. termitidis CT1112]